MIKFFRKIRQRLLSENKFSKYLLYAIGEIVLVVIGILIALQINNWNEEKKLNKKEQQILIQLKNEYEKNLIQLNEKISMRGKSIESAINLLSMIDNPIAFEETHFYNNIWRLARDPTFDPIKNDIVESEKLRIINNDTLIRRLSNWSTDAYQVQEIELQFQKFRTETMIPCFNRIGISRNFQNEMWKDELILAHALDKTKTAKLNINKTQKDLNWNQILNDLELEGVITWTITFHQIANLQSQALSERIDAIISILDREIKK